jgi:hypothetical protein
MIALVIVAFRIERSDESPETEPVDDVHQLQGILAELKLKFALFVDNQLASRKKNAGALVLVGIVQVKLARRHIVRHALRLDVGFGESDQA